MQIAENTLKTLQEVAQAVGAQQLVKAIEQISTRQAQKDCSLWWANSAPARLRCSMR